MIRGLVAVVCVWSCLTLFHAAAEELQREEPVGSDLLIYDSGLQAELPPAPLSPEQLLHSGSGLTWAAAQKIVDRHREALLRLPGVYSVGLGQDGIAVAIYVHSKTRDIDPQVLQKALAVLPAAVEGVPLKVDPLPVLPPPPGVVILKGDGTRELADFCPTGFNQQVQFGWHLCFAPDFVGPIPPLTAPPIEGVPFEKAIEILERHREELQRLPGVQGVGLGAEGIEIHTTNPAVVPQEVEGLPIQIHPPVRAEAGFLDLTSLPCDHPFLRLLRSKDHPRFPFLRCKGTRIE